MKILKVLRELAERTFMCDNLKKKNALRQRTRKIFARDYYEAAMRGVLI